MTCVHQFTSASIKPLFSHLKRNYGTNIEHRTTENENEIRYIGFDSKWKNVVAFCSRVAQGCTCDFTHPKCIFTFTQNRITTVGYLFAIEYDLTSFWFDTYSNVLVNTSIQTYILPISYDWSVCINITIVENFDTCVILYMIFSQKETKTRRNTLLLHTSLTYGTE